MCNKWNGRRDGLAAPRLMIYLIGCRLTLNEWNVVLILKLIWRYVVVAATIALLLMQEIHVGMLCGRLHVWTSDGRARTRVELQSTTLVRWLWASDCFLREVHQEVVTVTVVRSVMIVALHLHRLTLWQPLISMLLLLLLMLRSRVSLVNFRIGSNWSKFSVEHIAAESSLDNLRREKICAFDSMISQSSSWLVRLKAHYSPKPLFVRGHFRRTSAPEAQSACQSSPVTTRSFGFLFASTAHCSIRSESSLLSVTKSDDWSAAARGFPRFASTFDDEIEGSTLIECSLSSDCCHGSCCYHSDSSSSRASTSSFREDFCLIFGESWKYFFDFNTETSSSNCIRVSQSKLHQLIYPY